MKGKRGFPQALKDPPCRPCLFDKFTIQQAHVFFSTPVHLFNFKNLPLSSKDIGIDVAAIFTLSVASSGALFQTVAEIGVAGATAIFLGGGGGLA
jgi:hypothetical protein